MYSVMFVFSSKGCSLPSELAVIFYRFPNPPPLRICHDGLSHWGSGTPLPGRDQRQPGVPFPGGGSLPTEPVNGRGVINTAPNIYWPKEYVDAAAIAG